MNQQDLFRTVQVQQSQINQLKSQLNEASTFEVKYRKALKEISDIIKANRQLKQELKRLSNYKSSQSDNLNRINQEEIGKAYEKLLKEKNQLLGEKQALQLDNQKLKYSLASLQENVNRLKSQKMALARQKQGISKMNQNSNQRYKDSGNKQKEAELRKTLQNYQERHTSLTKTNRRLEQQITDLQNKIYSIQTDYKTKLNEKDIELKVSKTNAREEYQAQINSLKKQVTQLKTTNNQLMSKVSFYSQKQNISTGNQNQYQQQLIQTLRDLKMQMGPMSSQIAELQQKNEYEKEEAQRQKSALQIKVMQYQAEIQRIKQSNKSLEQKILKQTEKTRKWDDAEKTIRKLQEQNRMLGGRVIVLQAKQVALRNRSGDQLQERVFQFQTRVQMLLSDKQTIANTKNVGIHQLIALKAYIMQLDAKLKQVVNQNEYAVKKYKSYKQKCTQLIRQLKQHDIAINALKGKLQGYDRLVVKLQGQLQRAITINDNQMKAINVKISESTYNSIQIYKKRYESLLQKLNLQEKYAEQQIQTLKLNYDTKLLDLNLKLEQLSSIKETIGLYKSKNEQLSNKLTQRQNELLESKMTKIQITDTVPMPKNPHKDTINKLNQTINAKETIIINLQNQARKIELEWKSKYNQLQNTVNNSLNKKNRDEEQLKREIEKLENQIRTYRAKINELEAKSSQVIITRNEQANDYKNNFKFTGKISDLEIQLEQMRNRFQIQVTKVTKLTKSNAQLKKLNNDLQAQLSRLKFELKRMQKQMQLQLQGKDSEIKRMQSRVQQNYQQVTSLQKQQSEVNPFKLATLKMQIQLLQQNAAQLQKDKSKYYNRALQLERQNSELNMKIQELNFAIDKTKNNINNDYSLRQTQNEQQIERLQYNMRVFKDKNADLEDRINDYQMQIGKLRNQANRQRQRLLQEIGTKDEEISNISRQLNRIRSQIVNKDDIRLGIEQEYQYKISRLNNDVINLREQLSQTQNDAQRFQSELRFFKNRQMQINSKTSQQEKYVENLTLEIKKLKNRQVEFESELMDKQSIISKLTGELNFIRAQVSNIQDTLNNKDSIIAKFTSQLNNLRNTQIQWQMQISNKTGDYNRLNNELNSARMRVHTLQQELQEAKHQLSRTKNKIYTNQQSYSSQNQQIQQKEMIIIRIQSDNKAKTQEIQDLNQQINNKNSKIGELQGQINRYRSLSTDVQSELMAKQSQISRLQYQINNFKIKYQNLENQNQAADSNWNNLNRQLSSIKAQISGYEEDLSMKNISIQRYKSDIKQLQYQMERLNQEIFQKNKSINTLNQQLFSLKLQGQTRSSDQIYRLQGQISNLRSKVSNLQRQLQVKEQQLGRARLQASTIRSKITVNRYTDEQYDLLQAQFYQVQKSLTQTRGLISEKDLEITQLQAKIQYMKKIESQTKKRFNEQRNDLETQLQNVLNRQRQLRNQITNLQNQAILNQNRVSQDKQWGIHLYQNQCDRLTKIVSDLQQEVNSLKLKLTYMTNQQDRILENLTVMTLTFAEVQALRQRMKVKETQISQVRKSLINFATSSQQIHSSRQNLRQKTSNERGSYPFESQYKTSISNIELGNVNMTKKPQDVYNISLSEQKYYDTSIYQQRKTQYVTQIKSNYTSNQNKYVEKRNNGRPYQNQTIQQNNYEFQSDNYRQPQQSFKNKQASQQSNKSSEKNYNSNPRSGDQGSQSSLNKEGSLRNLQRQQAQVIYETQNYSINQTNQPNQKSQQSQSQGERNLQQGYQISYQTKQYGGQQNQKIEDRATQNQGQYSSFGQVGQANNPQQVTGFNQFAISTSQKNIVQSAQVNNQTGNNFAVQQSLQPISSTTQQSWRYGSSSSSLNQPNTKNQFNTNQPINQQQIGQQQINQAQISQAQINQGQQIQRGSQQNIKVPLSSGTVIGSGKNLGNIPVGFNNLTNTTTVVSQSIQSRQFGIPQPPQYPGFAR